MGNYKEGTLISEIKFNKCMLNSYNELPILEADFVDCGEWRLYYRPHNIGIGSWNGFNAYAVTFGRCSGNSEPFQGDTEILDFIEFSALFDGVRYMEIKRNDNEMEGYLYYPSGLTTLFQEVNKLMEKYCMEGEYDLL